MDYRAGMKLRSAVCTTEVVVVKPPKGGGELLCGGVAMLPTSAERPDGLSPVGDQGEGTQLGKRYVGEDVGVEVLCVKGGAGALALGDVPLALQGARTLPPSD